MRVLCKPKSFVSVLDQLSCLLRDEYLNKKGIRREDITGVSDLEKFLNCISVVFRKGEVCSYERIMALLEQAELKDQGCEISQEDINRFLSYMGKLLDAIQVLKPYTDRHKKIENFLHKALDRTGHKYIFDYYKTNNNKELEIILDEIRQTVAVLTLLEIVTRAYTCESNPIKNLRMSMKDRYPEEYFSEMIAGWIAEKYFLKLLEKNFTIQREGVDKDFNILLARSPKMGGADFIFEKNKKVELQRSSIDKFKIKQIKKSGNQNIVIMETPLKEHKLKNADIIVLWIGSEDIMLEKKCEKSFFWFIKINPLLTLFSVKGKGKCFFADVPKVTKKSPSGYSDAYYFVIKISNKINKILKLLEDNKLLWFDDNILKVLDEEKKQKYINSYDLRGKLESVKKEYKKVKEECKKTSGNSSNCIRKFLAGQLNVLKELSGELDDLFKILSESKDVIERSNANIIKLESKKEKIKVEMSREEFVRLLACENEVVEKMESALS